MYINNRNEIKDILSIPICFLWTYFLHVKFCQFEEKRRKKTKSNVKKFLQVHETHYFHLGNAKKVVFLTMNAPNNT
jgi:hypothetical protein